MAVEERDGALDGLTEMEVIARGEARNFETDTQDDLENLALIEQRRVYEQTTGKKIGKKKKSERSRARDEEEDDEPDEEEELDEENSLDDEDLEDEEDDDQDEESEDDEDEDDPELDSALSALRRIRAPKWVFRQSRRRLLELAESMADWQAHSDRDRTSRFDRIRAEEAGDRTNREASQENRNGADQQSRQAEDLDEAASLVVRALGVEEDNKDARRAVVAFGKAARGNADAEIQGLRKQLQDSAALQDLMLVRDAQTALADTYPQLVSDPRALDRFQETLIAQAGTGRYGSDLGRLYRDAAYVEFGPPKKGTEKGRRKTKRRKASGPVTRTKSKRVKKLERGTGGHDRQVYDGIRRKRSKRLAAGR